MRRWLIAGAAVLLLLAAGAVTGYVLYKRDQAAADRDLADEARRQAALERAKHAARGQVRDWAADARDQEADERDLEAPRFLHLP